MNQNQILRNTIWSFPQSHQIVSGILIDMGLILSLWFSFVWLVVEPECEKSSATTYFWYRETLDITSTIADSGGLNWRMTLSLLAAWIIVCLAVIKGIQSSGKVRRLAMAWNNEMRISLFEKRIHFQIAWRYNLQILHYQALLNNYTITMGNYDYFLRAEHLFSPWSEFKMWWCRFSKHRFEQHHSVNKDTNSCL